MTRFPKITVQKWTADGPAYTIHRTLAGFRNRKQRRARDGSGGSEELVGDHDAPESDAIDASLVYAVGDDELWAFREGHVYEVEITVDGEGAVIHVDAREVDALHEFSDGVRLVEYRALSEDEVAELLDDLEDPHANDYDELTAPGEKGPEGLELLEKQEALTGETLTSESEPEPEPEPDPEQLPTQPPAPATNHAPAAYVDAQDEALDRDGDYEANLDAVLEERAQEPEPAASPDDLSLEDLEALTAPDQAAATSEDAVGGDGGKPVDDDAE